MNKPLLIFIILALLIGSASLAYKHYCKSRVDGCKQEKFDEDDFGPTKGIDW